MIVENLMGVDDLNNLEIAPGVFFHQNIWRFPISKSESVRFDFSTILNINNTSLQKFEDLNLFIKSLVYYSFPDSFLTSGKSWSTSISYYTTLKIFAEDFFYESFLVDRILISKIDSVQLGVFIDRCIDISEFNGRARWIVLRLPSILRLWMFASETKSLPNWCSPNFQFDELVSDKVKEKQSWLIDEFIGSWSPLSPHQIKQTYNSAFYYIYEYSQTIIYAYDLIQRRPKGTKGQLTEVRKDGKSKELFLDLVKLDIPKFIGTGNPIFALKEVTKPVRSHGYKSGWQDRTTVDISGIRPEFIQLKRACIFIIGLLTGMRRREIANIKVNPIFLRDGAYYLKIIRFKTTTSPSKEGKKDEIPVPKIVADAVFILMSMFERQRYELNSDYLLVTDIITKKGYDKIKLDTIGKDIKSFILESSGDPGHTHQLRKTIAWLLISKGEENIDLIRQLFGHKSYGMALRYIMRNELLSGSVMELLEENYTEDLSEAISKIASGEAVGDLAESLKKRSVQHYPGQMLPSEIEVFVHTALEAGVPLFISRIPIGAFCVSTSDLAKKKPPCIAGTDEEKPNPEFCDYINCPHVLHTTESRDNVKRQINFFETKLRHLPDSGDDRVIDYYENKIQSNKGLLRKLELKAEAKVIAREGALNG
ncbi:tyrosine-type recombinase/integrase [Marinobacter changyiensis]|uniref:tyrosine-type recombinase/integrase n=1 Tax=Marinobacter changyiensis TaxID=2604091 RepID=UPI0012642AD3|nr:tyrosine-type recombinase/integrase [Marinobacter changyiensis]